MTGSRIQAQVWRRGKIKPQINSVQNACRPCECWPLSGCGTPQRDRGLVRVEGLLLRRLSFHWVRVVLYSALLMCSRKSGVVLLRGGSAMVPVRLVSMRLCLYRTSRVYSCCIGLCHSLCAVSCLHIVRDRQRVRSIGVTSSLLPPPEMQPLSSFSPCVCLLVCSLLSRPSVYSPSSLPMCTRPLACLLWLRWRLCGGRME